MDALNLENNGYFGANKVSMSELDTCVDVL